MKYFKQYYSDVEFEGQGEVKVLCPFHDDNKPSAYVNTEKNLFHCKVCGVGVNEHQFMGMINDISPFEASKLLNKLENDDNFIEEKGRLWSDDAKRLEISGLLHISEKTMDLLNLGITKDNYGNKYLAIPAMYDNILMDIRRYNLFGVNNVPKMMSNQGAESGLVIPYDIWKTDKNVTYVFEGEKDMLMGIEQGLNAITLTGGANAVPHEMYLKDFENKELVICYDNDEAGVKGAEHLYKNLKGIAKSIRYINIGDGVENEKEDFFDYIVKYEHDILDFLSLEVHEFDIKEDEKELTTIKEAVSKSVLKQKLKSNVTVSGEFADIYAVPEQVIFTKGEIAGTQDIMLTGETKEWFLNKKNLSQILELIEVGAKEDEIKRKIRGFAGVPSKERNVKDKTFGFKTIYKTRITDKENDGTSTSLDLYSFDNMAVGKQYEIDYQIFPHPTKHQKLVAITNKVKSLDDLEEYRPDISLLKKLQYNGSIKERLNHLYESAKNHIAPHLNYNIWLMDDLVFNSILEFDYGDRIRGALDVFVLGDTQVGKSETAEQLTKLYNFGHFISLKTSTTVGLIGGSNKVEGSWLNTIGAIPRQHKGLAVLEEFSGAKPDFIKTMTDVRSSGRLRLARAAGEMDVECRLRMISISNPVNDSNGNPRNLDTFPNGVVPIMELITSAEDVSRYDGFLLTPKPKTRVNKFRNKLDESKKIDILAYPEKIKWVATRMPENVIFEDDVDAYIWDKAEELNDMFESNFPLFTTTTSLKLSRFSVALASLLINTDASYRNVIVTKEIVDYIVDWLISIYDNDVFKLKEYKTEYESYKTVTPEDTKRLNDMYSRNAVLLNYLAHQSSTTQPTMKAVSGLDSDDFGKVFNRLVQYKMIRLSKGNMYPTGKFQKAMRELDAGLLTNMDTMISTNVDDDIF